jgi:hypothetical protein
LLRRRQLHNRLIASFLAYNLSLLKDVELNSNNKPWTNDIKGCYKGGLFVRRGFHQIADVASHQTLYSNYESMEQ